MPLPLRLGGRARASVALILALAALGLPAGSADAARPLRLGFVDPVFRSQDAQVRQQWLQQTSEDGGEIALAVVSWRSVAPASPAADFEPTDPADPGYDWGTLDAMVRDASTQGLGVVLTVTSAPDWAEGADRPPRATPGTWKPQPAKLGDFATALARRYSGSFVDPAAGVDDPPLPRVGYYQAWAEANLPTRLTPQWSGTKNRSGPPRPRAAEVYRPMLNAFYGAIKQVDPSMKVISTGTAPYGDSPGGTRIRPLTFWRELLCLHGRDLDPRRCPSKAHFDVFAHHPINTSGPPSRPPVNPDDISSANLRDLVEALRRAERAKRVEPAGRRPVWVTEFWYPTDPRPHLGVSPARQAAYVAESLYLFWRAGASLALNLRIRDAAGTDVGLPGTGFYYLNGRAKPAARAFRFPFVADRIKGSRLRLWGKSPEPGPITIERRRNDAWRPVKQLRAGGSRVFSSRIQLRGRTKLRARTAGSRSLAWTVSR